MNDKQYSGLIQILDTALKNLETVTKSAKNAPLHIYDFDVSGGRLVTRFVSGVETAFQLIASYFYKGQKKVEKRSLRVRGELMRSIEVLKKHYRLIQKLQKGTASEQAWANHAIDVINSYNALLMKEKLKPKSLLKRVKKTFFEQSGISLLNEELRHNLIHVPHELFLRFESEKSSAATMGKIAQELKEGRRVEYTPKEYDIFCMRAITLAKNSNLPPEMYLELNQMMRAQPIHATLAKEEADSSTISLMQQITAFPGETITVQGNFQRNVASLVPSVPDPKSFRVSTLVTQTGCPHPSQYTGWALSHHLCPENPLRMDLLPNFHAVQQIKSQLAAALLPGARLNLKAKELLKLKKRAFDENSEELIAEHKILSKAILAKAPYEGLEPKEVQVRVDQFYEGLLAHPTPFDYLSETHALINRSFIDPLSEKLHVEWQELQNQILHTGSPRERYVESQRILHTALAEAFDAFTDELKLVHSHFEFVTLKFILLMGQVLGEASVVLLLQHFSEKIGYAPPLLTHFEQYLQSCLFRQILAFEQELELTIPEIKEELLPLLKVQFIQHLKQDNDLFLEREGAEEPTTNIALELERYYNARYSFSQNR